MAEPGPARLPPPVPFGAALRVWIKIGFLSFGGPAGQIALMHRLIVEEKRWLDEVRFLHALNYCMLLPGPEAQQLATYTGWLLHGVRGGLVAGLLFILPGLVIILALSILYGAFFHLALVQSAFLGVKMAVLAIVVQALLGLSRRTLTSWPLAALALLAFFLMYALNVPFPFVVIGAALAGAIAGRRPGVLGDGPPARPPPPAAGRRSALATGAVWLALWLVPVAALFLILGPENVFTRLALFFSQMAVVTFGGAYAVLAYVAQEAVQGYGWLGAGEMVDGLGLAETTPGPLILVLNFVGYLAAYRAPGPLDPVLAGTLGVLVTSWVTFVPCFLWIFLGAPWAEQLRSSPALSAALRALTAAVVGVMANLSLWFALHVLFTETRVAALPAGLGRLELPVVASLDPAAALIALAALAAVFIFRMGIVALIVAAAVAGLGLGFLPD